ncbi:MAG: TRAP transporter substrate-binding protein DctP [Spirochaetes bacterium]|nr:TRAP transporter substrate-binding protein DctP [Spirochaetota bacterium]
MKKSLIFILTAVFALMLAVDSNAQGKVINLKFNDWNPDGTPATTLWKDVVKMVDEKSKGRIKITNYLAGSLLKFPETFKGVSTGVADISLYLLGGAPGIHELCEIYDLPLLGFKNYWQAFRIYTEILNEFPELQAENEAKNVRILSIRPMPAYWIHSVKKPIRVPADMKGQKVIATGYYGTMATYGGGIAMQTGPMDWYSGLQKGVVQHIITAYPPLGVFKLHEVTKYHVQFGEGGCGNSGMAVLINLDLWKKLSAEDRAILVEAYSWYQKAVAESDLKLEKMFIGISKKMNQTFIQLKPAQINQWKNTAGKEAIEKWIARTEAKGKPARKVYEAMQAKIKKYK